MKLHFLCTSCLLPNTSVGVAVSDYNQRFEQTKNSILNFCSLPQSDDITIYICDISSIDATLRLYDYCISHLPSGFRIKPLTVTVDEHNTELCKLLGKGYSEYLMLQCYYDHLSTLYPASYPDTIIKVGARSLPSNLQYLVFLLKLFRKQKIFAYCDNRFAIYETRCFALKPFVLGAFLNCRHIKRLNDVKKFYIEHALYAFAKGSSLSAYPIPFIPLYSSLIGGSSGSLINENIFSKALKFIFFGWIK